mgnify:CR=1 FL=1
MARKNGCPFSVRDWSISIRSRGSTNELPTWIPIKGLNSMEYTTDADTEDGSSAQDLWGEPYVTKRTGSVTLEAKRVVDSITGAADPGQAELNYYATLGGCDADARLKLVDAVGNATLLDAVVTSAGDSADDTSETVSYDMEVVGEPIPQTYVQATAVAVKDGATAVTTLSMDTNDTKELTVAFTPATASNQKFAVSSSDASKVKVLSVDGLTFELQALAVGSSTVTVRSMNNSLTATVTVTVTTSG